MSLYGVELCYNISSNEGFWPDSPPEVGRIWPTCPKTAIFRNTSLNGLELLNGRLGFSLKLKVLVCRCLLLHLNPTYGGEFGLNEKKRCFKTILLRIWERCWSFHVSQMFPCCFKYTKTGRLKESRFGSK